MRMELNLLELVVLFLGTLDRAKAQFSDEAVELAVAHARLVGTSAVTVFSCDRAGGGGAWGRVRAARALGARGLAAQVFSVDARARTEWPGGGLREMLRAAQRPLALVLQLRCDGAEDVLREASTLGYTRRLHHWLLLEGDSVATSNRMQVTTGPQSEQVVSTGTPSVTDLNVAGSLELPLDNCVRFAAKEAGAAWAVRGAYQLAGRPLTVEEPVLWSPGAPLPPLPLRLDLQGITLRIGIVVTMNEPWSQHNDLRYKHLNTWTKVNYKLVELASERLNFSIVTKQTNTWGYLENGSWTGMVRMVQLQEVDIGGAGLAMKASRMDIHDYTAETIPFYPKFLFRQPRLSGVSNVYTLPFSRTVWAVYLSTVLGLTLVLVATQRVLAPLLRDEDALPEWRDAFLFACGIICDEGYPQNPGGLSSRIVLLALLLLSVFHVTSYGACIVSLLQAPSSGYDTLQDLVDSPLRMAMEDIPYNVNFENETSDPVVRKFFRERMKTQPRAEAFLSLEEGVARVRRGMFAFHVDDLAYKAVAETFLEHEKCGLKMVPMFPPQVLSMSVPRGSPYRELFRYLLRWFREVGLITRERVRWYTQKPTCRDAGSSFVTVGLVEFRPAVAVVAVGLLTALTVLLLEMVAVRLPKLRGKLSRKRRPSKRQTVTASDLRPGRCGSPRRCSRAATLRFNERPTTFFY